MLKILQIFFSLGFFWKFISIFFLKAHHIVFLLSDALVHSIMDNTWHWMNHWLIFCEGVDSLDITVFFLSLVVSLQSEVTVCKLMRIVWFCFNNRADMNDNILQIMLCLALLLFISVLIDDSDSLCIGKKTSGRMIIVGSKKGFCMLTLEVKSRIKTKI